MTDPPASRPSDVSEAIRAAFRDTYRPPLRTSEAATDHVVDHNDAAHLGTVNPFTNALRLLAQA